MARGHRNPVGSTLSSIITFVIILAAVWMLRSYVITPYRVPSGSMEDTILINDRVLSEHLSYYARDPKPGEVITFDDPEQPGRTLVKRVIATEGQTINLQRGILYVDGIAQNEPYTHGRPSEPLQTAGGVSIRYPYTVPNDEVWVMGDNRTNSADSRYFGAVPVDSVSGHVVVTYWPLDRVSVLN